MFGLDVASSRIVVVTARHEQAEPERGEGADRTAAAELGDEQRSVVVVMSSGARDIVAFGVHGSSFRGGVNHM